ncbi:Open rectifier potassium channel protein 1 [Toxocara canis]|uniref:Open rectifier potassium channel protein 1 n=1 Tax=Toxocara canis TaxID=6265 RepID=A0A0B2UPS4_TOXCA|nr:Open rectifier potassium channel protein 1 [Toxocara canis]
MSDARMSSENLFRVKDTESLTELKKIYDALIIPHARPKLCCLFYFPILSAYVCFGGAIFWMTDFRASYDAQKRFERVCITQKQAAIRDLWTSYLGLNSSVEGIQSFWNEISRAIDFVDKCHRESLRHLKPKTFRPFESIAFSFGVITTIGYGDVVVRSVPGRLLSILYAVIGIPLNVAFTADFGEMIANLVTRIIDHFRKLYATYIQRSGRELEPLSAKTKFIVLLFTTTIFLVIVARITMHLEKDQHWSYIDSLYFTFATASVIGYGDLTTRRPAAYVLILMPLFFVAETLLCLVYGFIQNTFRFHVVAVVRLLILYLRRSWNKHRKKHYTVQPASAENILNEKHTWTGNEAIDHEIQSSLSELHKIRATNSAALLSVPMKSERTIKRELRSRIKAILTKAEAEQALLKSDVNDKAMQK